MNKNNYTKPQYSIVFFLCLMYFNVYSQQWSNIGNVEYYFQGDEGYYEILNEYSGRNVPQFDLPDFDETAIFWNNNDFIYYLEITDRSRMWKFSISIKQWKCIYDKESVELYSDGIGVESDQNNPGRRKIGANWIDNDGNLWLFSGEGFSDLWRYNTSTDRWTFISGSLEDGSGMYVDKGASSTISYPSARSRTVISFIDNNNDIILFRGNNSNDLWKYNIAQNEWTWVSGINPVDVSFSVTEFISNDGTELDKNTPAGNNGYSIFWTNENNDYFLLEGNGTRNIYQIWKFEQSSGYWLSEKKIAGFPNHSVFGVEDVSTEPTKHSNSYHWIHENYLYIFGGQATGFGIDYTNVLYKLNLENYNWTWLKGVTKIDKDSIGTNFDQIPLQKNPGFVHGIGNPHELNLPSRRSNGISWIEGNKLYLGYGKARIQYLYDIWALDVTTNNFELSEVGRAPTIDDFNLFTYNKEYEFNNVPQPIYFTLPNEDYYDLATINQGDSLLHFFNNLGVTSTDINTNITKVLKQEMPTNHGEIGVEDESVYPSFRTKILGLHDDKVYLIDYVRFEMYSFNLITNNFTCIKKLDEDGVSELLDFDELNFPSSRVGYASWISKEGNIYLYSGTKREDDTFPKRNTDLWVYDISINQWAWLSGNISGETNENEHFPKGRTRFNHWIDKDDNLWIFGGFIETNTALLAHYHQTDMWKYDIKSNVWEQISMGPGVNNMGYYGDKDEFSIFNTPGGRARYANLVDKNNKFWMINGNALKKQDLDFATDRMVLDDIWMFDPIIKHWVWIDGLQEEVKVNDQYFNYYNNKKPALRIGFSTFPSHPLHNTYSFSKANEAYIYENYIGGLWNINTSDLTPDYNIFGGTAIYDSDLNGCDSLDSPFVNLKIVVNEFDAYTFTDSDGQYFQFCNETICDAFPSYYVDYFNFEPDQVQLDFGGYGQYENVDFCVTPKGDFNDLEVTLIPLSQPNPGFDSNYKIHYVNSGTTTQSDVVISLIYDTEKLDFEESEPDTTDLIYTTYATNFDTLNWVIDELNPFESGMIDISMRTNPNNNPCDSILSIVNISSELIDESPENNSFVLYQKVVASFDPNDKTIAEGNLLPIEKIGDYVHYLIRFENTGTANANFVVLRDFIDEDLFDLSSIVPITASHQFELKMLEDQTMQVYFKNIDLPFEGEDGNKGFFLFKIKSNQELKGGDLLLNTANIYFDYNDPIVTNESESMFEIVLSLKQNETYNGKIYPNPASQYFTFNMKNVVQAEIINSQGVVTPLKLEYNRVDLNNIPQGNYYIKLYYDDDTSTIEHLVKIE